MLGLWAEPRHRRAVWACGAALTLVGCTVARAADAEVTPAPGDVPPAVEQTGLDATFGVNLTSDYVFRGVSQTDEGPAVQPFLEARYGTFYGGAFLSNVDFNAPEPDVEADFSFGVRPTWAGINFDFGGIYYMYPDDPVELDYFEGLASASYTFQETVTVTGRVFASPDFVNTGSASGFVEGLASIALPHDLSLSGGLGAQFVEDDVLEDYTTWNVGLSHKLLEVVTLDVRYHDSTLSGADCAAYSGAFDSCEERVVGSVRLDIPLGLFTSR